MVQQRKNQSCQSKNKSCLISSALDKKYSELLTYEQKALQILDNLQGSDVFNFDQDVVELIKNIESSQAILDNYISELKRLV